jgi:hypothetical protein
MEESTIIADLKKKIEEKEKELGTSMSSGYHSASPIILDKYTQVDIPMVKSKNRLVYIAGELLKRKGIIKEGAEFLDITPDYTLDGFTLNEWLEDVKTRMEALTFLENTAKITEWKARLDSLLTEEEWRELEITKLMDELDA